MNSKYQKLENNKPQSDGRMNFILKSTIALMVIILSMFVLWDVNKGNMVLSLAWPILLLPFLSASKELCVLLTRLVSGSDSGRVGDRQGVLEA
jgi:uncharacterized protein YqhQ